MKSLCEIADSISSTQSTLVSIIERIEKNRVERITKLQEFRIGTHVRYKKMNGMVVEISPKQTSIIVEFADQSKKRFFMNKRKNSETLESLSLKKAINELESAASFPFDSLNAYQRRKEMQKMVDQGCGAPDYAGTHEQEQKLRDAEGIRFPFERKWMWIFPDADKAKIGKKLIKQFKSEAPDIGKFGGNISAVPDSSGKYQKLSKIKGTGL